MPGKHALWPPDYALPQVMGSLVGSEARGTDLSKRCITGDTPVVDDLEEISKHYPYVGVMLLHPERTKALGPRLPLAISVVWVWWG